MNKTWLVMRNEVITNVTRRSWLLIAFGLPLVLALIVIAGMRMGSTTPAAPSGSSNPGTQQLDVEGYVDRSGIVRMVPEDLRSTLIAYPDEASAQEALDSDEIASYYVVPADYVEAGRVLYVDPDFKGFAPEGQAWVMRWTLLVNLLDGDVKLAQLVSNPMEEKVTALQPEPAQRKADLGWGYWIPYATAMILYGVIIMSSSLLRESFGKEKKCQVMEVLMLSVNPRRLLTGKVIGLGFVGLLQTLIWAGTGYSLLRLAGRTLNLPAGFELPLSIVGWAAVFFLLGYAVYASLLAGLGALTGPNQMGSSSADFIVVWPMIIPLFFMTFLIQSPNGALAVAVSMFPFTAPVGMMTRLAAGRVPVWQPALAAMLMAVTALLVVRAVARVFRAQMLLSGQPYTVKRYFAVLLGRG